MHNMRPCENRVNASRVSGENEINDIEIRVEKPDDSPPLEEGSGVVFTNRTYKYSEFAFRNEEKFLVLPDRVKTRIETVLLNWLLKRPRTRLCFGNVLGLSLTVLAHSAHHMYMDWNRFLDATMDDGVLLRVIRCFKTTVPEPGTYMGEIVAQFFQHCKQQSNLNVKRKLRTDDAQHRKETNERGSRPIGDGKKSGPARCLSSKRSDIDKKFETVMSLKRMPQVSIMFRIAQKAPFNIYRTTSAKRGRSTIDASAFDARSEVPECGETAESALLDYLKKRVFGALCYSDDSPLLEKVNHEFCVPQFRNFVEEDVYFSLDIWRTSKYDLILDNIFQSVHLYNRSLETVKHRMGECNVVYCSDTVYFMSISKRLFVDNSVTFIYCYLTNKHMPIIETREDTDAFGLAKILSSVEYSTKCSLKRNHSSRMGHGPLSSVISEGGLNESAKFVNNMMRKYILRYEEDFEDSPSKIDQRDASVTDVNVYVPQSPNYSPTQSPPEPCERRPTASEVEGRRSPFTVATMAGTAVGIGDKTDYPFVQNSFFINEPYVNAFLNRPVECGSMY